MGRLPSTGFGTTSLGAVGGARGTAAGALRILVEFLTQYDSKAVKQLQSDLNSLTAVDQANAKKVESSEKALLTIKQKSADLEEKITKTIAQRAANPRRVNSQLAVARRAGVLNATGREQLEELAGLQGLGRGFVNDVVKLAQLERARLGVETRITREKEKQKTSNHDLQATEAKLGQLTKLRQQFLPKLAGLGIGAIGGIVGGAVLGVGFTAAEAAIEQIGEKIQDIIDPARHAREVVDDLGASIRDLAKDNGGDLKAAAGEFLKQFGIEGDDRTKEILAQAAAIEYVNKQLEIRAHLLELTNHEGELQHDLVVRTAQQYAREAGAVEELVRGLRDEAFLRGRPDLQAQAAQFTARAERELSGAQEDAAASALRAQVEAYNLERARRAQAGAAQLAAFAEQKLADAISSAAQPGLDRFAAQIEAAQGAGPSRRTRALEAQIERLQNAGQGGGGRNQELANIAEERALILLRMRLRLLGTNINLEKYSGKFLLEAINAKLKALQKEAAAQDRLNRLLDLQFKMSQKLRRNAGESITDFLQRRAQENRGLLSEQRDIERQTIEEHLQELQDKTQDEVALQELAERRKNAVATGGADTRIKALQKELEASRKADAAATAAKIKALQKQQKAYEQARDKAIEYASDTKNEAIRIAIEQANTIADIQKVSGEISGLTAAAAFIRGLLASGAIPPDMAKDLQQGLTRIMSTLGQYQSKLHNITTGHAVGKGPLEFAEGGVIMLNNSSTPFGANVHFGDGMGGSEAAVILQHQVAKGLKNMGRGIGEQNFYMQAQDPYRDKFAFKQMVKEAVSEAMR